VHDLAAERQPHEAELDGVPQLFAGRVPAAGVVGEDLEGHGQEWDSSRPLSQVVVSCTSQSSSVIGLVNEWKRKRRGAGNRRSQGLGVHSPSPDQGVPKNSLGRSGVSASGLSIRGRSSQVATGLSPAGAVAHLGEVLRRLAPLVHAVVTDDADPPDARAGRLLREPLLRGGVVPP